MKWKHTELFVRYLYINVYYPYHVIEMPLIYYIICIINYFYLIYRQLLKCYLVSSAVLSAIWEPICWVISRAVRAAGQLYKLAIAVLSPAVARPPGAGPWLTDWFLAPHQATLLLPLCRESSLSSSSPSSPCALLALVGFCSFEGSVHQGLGTAEVALSDRLRSFFGCLTPNTLLSSALGCFTWLSAAVLCPCLDFALTLGTHKVASRLLSTSPRWAAKTGKPEPQAWVFPCGLQPEERLQKPSLSAPQ